MVCPAGKLLARSSTLILTGDQDRALEMVKVALVIIIEPAGENSLLIQIFVWHKNKQVSARLYQFPPLQNGGLGLVHVF